MEFNRNKGLVHGSMDRAESGRQLPPWNAEMTRRAVGSKYMGIPAILHRGPFILPSGREVLYLENSVNNTEISRYTIGMIKRNGELKTITGLIRRHPVVALIGARQVGKTTLAHSVASNWKGDLAYYDLEDPGDQARLSDPMLALRNKRGLVIIDEVQRQPDLFSVLRVLVDNPKTRIRFLLLGSALPGLLRQSAETLAGRIHYHELGGFNLDEVGISKHERLWIRGAFPRSFLSRSNADSHEWREGFIRTFLERDLPQLGVGVSATTMRRFWTMLAHYHGQVWNASEFARSFGVADTTVRNYLDTLSSAMVVEQLQPWHANLAKRQVKSPKVYLADTGLLHALLNLRTLADVTAHPKCGASWEAFAMQEVRKQLGVARSECYFWATHAGAELDMMVVRGSKKIGFEFKRTSKPEVTPSMRIALRDLGLKRIDVIYPGDDVFPLSPGIRAVGIACLSDSLGKLE